MSFFKFHDSMLRSSVWATDNATKVVWVSMLAMKDQHGFVQASESGVRRAANVTEEECSKALRTLEGPDPENPDQPYAGARILRVEGGWQVVTHEKYRSMRDPAIVNEQARERMRRHREKSNGGPPEPKKPSTALSRVTGGKLGPRGHDAIMGHAVEFFVELRQKEELRDKVELVRRAKAELVFSYWQVAFKHMAALYDDVKARSRGRLIMARLEENGDNVSELLYALDGARRDKYIMGQNPEGKKFDSIETIFRDRSQVERFAEAAKYERGMIHKAEKKYVLGEDGPGA